MECNTALQFNMGDRRQCYNITIDDDDTCESVSESFTVQLLLLSGSGVSLNQQYEFTTNIINDLHEEECSKKMIS